MKILTEALSWIVNLLNDKQIPYQLTGGLGAHAYGATRPIHDIDIDIPEDRFSDILDAVKPYIIFGPGRYRDKVWDLELITLNYKGQEIDIGGAYDTKIMDEKTGEWHHEPDDLSKVNEKNLFGVDVKVAPKESLVKYKSWLAMPGDHQEQDVREMLASD